VPLIVVMLVVFVIGVIFGLLVAAQAIMRRRREVKKLKRELARLQERINHPSVPTEAVAPETIAPLAPL
jgi:uncharacterized membrane protein YciS (DUF1049 family)